MKRRTQVLTGLSEAQNTGSARVKCRRRYRYSFFSTRPMQTRQDYSRTMNEGGLS